ncbi:MAG: hypothetical protein LUQ71_03010 [Methanoregula sp.]|jgi:hypothetical protein|nr:hypothetical protein [Methanoregula sp.]
MKIILFLSIAFAVSVLFLLTPVHAADNPDNDMLKNARNLNMTVPEKGNAVLGTRESMTEMLDWLNACSRVLITFFNDTMNLLGLSNTSYVKDMNKAFDTVMKSPPSITR